MPWSGLSGNNRRQVQTELPWSATLSIKENCWSIDGLDWGQIRIICCDMKGRGEGVWRRDRREGMERGKERGEGGRQRRGDALLYVHIYISRL